MKKKQFFILLVTFFSITGNTQSNAEKKSLVGSWTVEEVEYDDYYSYDVKKDALEIGGKLSPIIYKEANRFDKGFLDKLKKAAAQYARQSSFTINADGTYTMSIDGKTESGTYSFLPKKRNGNEESDITYNMAHLYDFAVIELKNGDSFGVRKNENNKLSFLIYNELCSISFIK
jgi:hypothetical protein